MQGQMQNPNQETKFDIRTHRFDHRGRLKSRNLHRVHVQNGTVLYERPVNSGNLFYENNQPAGRVEVVLDERGKIKSKKFDHSAMHKEFVAPLTGSEKLHFENQQLSAQLQAAMKELEAIKAEKAKNADVGTTKENSKASPLEKAVAGAPEIEAVAPPKKG